MKSVYLAPEQIAQRTARNDAFWEGRLDHGPLIWVTAPDLKPGLPLAPPATDAELWTNVEYVIQAAHNKLSQTCFAGDALPVYTPWLGPDQFAAWLGADLQLNPRENTSWVLPFVQDWDQQPLLTISPENPWWTLYLRLLRACSEFGKDKWITGYPDLHTGIDALCAVRGPSNLMIDLLSCPDVVKRHMRQMTQLWKFVIDATSEILLPNAQGTSNWTMGYSSRRFLCIGQNDFSCMISPGFFEEFCLADITETCCHVDFSLYHLDGAGAIKHVPSLLKIRELTAIQWIQGAGNPPPGQWLDLLRQIQGGGKAVQVRYPIAAGLSTDELFADVERVLKNLDVRRLFLWIDANTPAEADMIVRSTKRLCGGI